MKTLRVCLPDSDNRLRDSFASLDDGQREKPLGSQMAKVNALWEVQSASGEELSALMPSILDRAFKGEL